MCRCRVMLLRRVRRTTRSGRIVTGDAYQESWEIAGKVTVEVNWYAAIKARIRLRASLQ